MSDVDARGEPIAGALGTGVGGRPAHYGGRPVARRRRANGKGDGGDTLSSFSLGQRLWTDAGKNINREWIALYFYGQVTSIYI